MKRVAKGPAAVTRIAVLRQFRSSFLGAAMTDARSAWQPEICNRHLPVRRIARNGPIEPPKISHRKSRAAIKCPHSCKITEAKQAPRSKASKFTLVGFDCLDP